MESDLINQLILDSPNVNVFELLLESIPQMAWTALPNGERNYFNQRWYEYIGQEFGQAKGDGWKKTQHPDDLQSTTDAYKNLVCGMAYSNEHRFKRSSDGMWRWHLTRAIPIRNSRGAIILWVGTCTDIHDLKSTLDKLDATQNQLQVLNEDLYYKNDQLTRINLDLDNFVYSATHDLKAPINNIKGIIELILCKILNNNTDIITEINLMEKSIKRFDTVISDLGEIGKSIQSISNEVSKISIRNIVENVIEDFQSVINQNQIVINLNIEIDAINFSKQNMRSIVYNLLSNAIKYRDPDRSLIINVSTQIYNQKFILLSIDDNGLGISKNEISKIFQMYERVHTHLNGNGIGLALIKRIMDNYNGEIVAESEIGKGSTFKVFFPYKP